MDIMSIRRSLVIGYETCLSCLRSVLFRFCFFSPLNNLFLPCEKAHKMVLNTAVIGPLISLLFSHSIKFRLHCLCPSSGLQTIHSVCHLKYSAHDGSFPTAALDVGCARTTWPHWYAYALVNDRQVMKIVFTPLSVSLCFLCVLSLSSSFLFPLHFFLTPFLPSTQHDQL